MPIRFDLKNAIAKKYGTQIEASRALGIRESRLSYLVRGHVDPTDEEMKILRLALGRNLIRRAFDRSNPESTAQVARAAS